MKSVLIEASELTPTSKRRATTPKQYAALEAAIGEVPGDLRALYAWSGNLDAVITADEAPEWLGVDDAIAQCKLNRKVAEFRRTLFPLATDGGGNFSCFDVSTGRIVDWDHETRKVSPLAPDLARFLRKELLAPLKRQFAEERALADDKGNTIEAGPAPTAMPSKVAQLPNALFAKFDRESHGGGAKAVLFVGDAHVFLGFQNGGEVISLASQTSKSLSRGASAAAFDETSGRLLVVDHGNLTLIDVARSKTLARWTANIGWPTCAAWSSDGALAVSGDTTGTLLVWDLKGLKGIPTKVTNEFAASYTLPKGTPIASLSGHEGWVCAEFSPDAALLASGDAQGTLCLWDAKKRSRIAAAKVRGESIRGVSFLRDGQGLAIGLESGEVQLLDSKLKLTRKWKTKDWGNDVHVLGSGAVASVGQKLLQLWDPTNGRLLAKVARKKGQHVAKISGEQGALLITSGPAGLYRIS